MDARAAQRRATAELLEKMDRLERRKVSLRQRQELESTDPGVPGNVWVSKVEWPVEASPELKSAVVSAWEHTKYDDAQYYDFDVAPLVSAEWIGARREPASKESDAPTQPQEAFSCLNEDTKNPLTIFYIHGGSFVWGSGARSRPVPASLASLSNARAFSANYRLAPQHPIPAAVLDILTLYLYLLSPPPGALHSPVLASSIVFAAESSGGALAVALVLVLLHLRQQKPTISFNGRDVPVELPAGLALLSPCFDFLTCLPSAFVNNENDWIWGAEPWLRPDFPADDIWPSNPPRTHIYCHDTAIAHPFLNAAATDPEDLRGFPPVWISCGEEVLLDSVKVFAKHLSSVGAKVDLTVYEGMPHVFALLTRALPQSKRCIGEWVQACVGMVKEKTRKSRAVLVEMGDLNLKEIDMANLTSIELREVRLRMTLRKILLAGLVWNGPKKGLDTYARPKL